jgi:FAD/FMN-containing dehydrogenase
MSPLEVSTRTGSRIVLEESAAQRLAESLGGELLRPGDDTYDEARRVWNGLIDHRPALIARCAGNTDVSAAVTFAREHDLLVSVRGGGHNIAGKAVCIGGLVIDLSRMRSVAVDSVNRTAWVEGGATLGEVDSATQLAGLATTTGVVTHTGVAGLTLGGGVGRLARKCGLACDNLLSADVVTADGHLLTTSAAENSTSSGACGAPARISVSRPPLCSSSTPWVQKCSEASLSTPWRGRRRHSSSIMSTRVQPRTS